MSNRVSRRQANRWAEQEAPQQQQQPRLSRAYAPPPPAARHPPRPVDIAQLKELAALQEQGVLTDAEFERAEGTHPRLRKPSRARSGHSPIGWCGETLVARGRQS